MVIYSVKSPETAVSDLSLHVLINTPQQSILTVLDPPSQDELLLPVHELPAETMATTLETPSNVRTLNGQAAEEQTEEHRKIC